MAEYQQNRALEGESQQHVQHQLQQGNKNLVANLFMAPSNVEPVFAQLDRLTVYVPSLHGHYLLHGSIAFYLMKNPMSLNELMRKQYHPGYLWYNIDSAFNRLKIKLKEWHQTVTPDLRIQMIKKVCEGIFPTAYIKAYCYTKSHIMAANARVFEGEAYAMANSISEYYYLLDNKIDIIQKRQKRQEQHLAQQQQQQQQQQGNKNLVANSLVIAAGSLNSKSPNMQSPPNVSLSKIFVDQQMVVSMGNLSMKKQLCDEIDSDNLESSDIEETGEIGLDEYKTITPDLRVPKTKEWHQKVTLRSRMRIIYQILETLFPSECEDYWIDVGSYNMYAFVRRVEADIYEMANSKSEYYQLLAEKIYEIQMDHEKQQPPRPLLPSGLNLGSPPDKLGAKIHEYRARQMALFHATRAKGNAPPPAPAAPESKDPPPPPATDTPATETILAPAVKPAAS